MDGNLVWRDMAAPYLAWLRYGETANFWSFAILGFIKKLENSKIFQIWLPHILMPKEFCGALGTAKSLKPPFFSLKIDHFSKFRCFWRLNNFSEKNWAHQELLWLQHCREHHV